MLINGMIWDFLIVSGSGPAGFMSVYPNKNTHLSVLSFENPKTQKPQSQRL
jgi:hypothetical protein